MDIKRYINKLLLLLLTSAECDDDMSRPYKRDIAAHAPEGTHVHVYVLAIHFLDACALAYTGGQ